MPKTISEIMKAGISFVTEDDSFYYIRPLIEKDVPYDNTIWRIDKKTNEIQYMDYTAYIIDVEEKTKSVDPKVLEKPS